MTFNKHFELKGKHAFLGASKWHWINYNEDKLVTSFYNYQAIEKGTELHEFAAQCIRLRQKLPKSKKTINMYVNDAIGFKMIPEQPLYFSENCFGTPDAICFNNNMLRIHDFKSGVIPAHIEQLEVYAALFFLEYCLKPNTVKIELRIYQNDEVLYHNPEPSEIVPIMDKIITFDKILKKIKEGD